MEAHILDKDFNTIYILDVFNSFIWTDRYNKYGDFEITTEVSDSLLDNLRENYYICLKSSDHAMIIEDLSIDTDVETGNILTISGRSLESILDRRIIWNITKISGNLQEAIKKLINENIISPAIEERKIPNFIFEDSTDENITKLEIEAGQYMGENLYDVITSICDYYSIGFKIYLNENNQFVFKLYCGIDRSYKQEIVPYVVFSPSFENIINSSFFQSNSLLKNVSLIRGEGEGANVKTAIVKIGSETGLNRRELYTDARDIMTYDGEATLSDEEYTKQLKQRGIENLNENVYVKSFSGQVETTNMFVYGTDFYMGDIVQIVNEYNMESRSRIIELIQSHSADGYTIYPTFDEILYE